MSKFFDYKGYRLKPIGNIYNAFMKRKYITWEYTLDIDGYSHKDFYKKAKKEQCSCDIFEYGGKLYIPCDKTLFGIAPNTPIKRCSMYDNWYKWSRYKNTHFDKEFIELLEKIKDTYTKLYFLTEEDGECFECVDVAISDEKTIYRLEDICKNFGYDLEYVCYEGGGMVSIYNDYEWKKS